jgi:hypothetical protein
MAKGTPAFSSIADIVAFLKDQVRHPELPSVFCMIRDGFEHDVTELRQRSRRYNWLRLPAVSWHNVQVALGSPAVLSGQFYNFDFRAPEFDAYWQKTETFCITLLKILQREVKLAAIMAANFDYGIDEGLRRACTKLPIPFLTLNRELAILKRHFDSNNSYYRNYKYPPIIDATAVGSEMAHFELVEWGVLRPDQVHRTGLPRQDPLRELLNDPSPPALNTIVLFNYLHPDYLGGHTFDESLETFVAAADRHPHITFVVKCKHRNDSEAVKAMLQATPAHRLTISTDSSASVLRVARAAVGLNSMAMVEALLSNAELLVPQWGEARGPEEDQAFWRENEFHRKHVTFLDSRAHLDQAIDRIATGNWKSPADMGGRIALLQQFLHYDPDRSASEAVEDFVDLYVKRRQAGR